MSFRGRSTKLFGMLPGVSAVDVVSRDMYVTYVPSEIIFCGIFSVMLTKTSHVCPTVAPSP